MMTDMLPLRRAWPKITARSDSPLAARSAHVVLSQGLQHAGTGDAGDGCDQAGGEGDGGQDQMLPGSDARDVGKSLKCTEKIRIRTMARKNCGVTIPSTAPMVAAVSIIVSPAQRGENAQGQAEGNAQHDGRTSQAETVGQPLEDHARGGHAVAEGVAEVEL